MQCPCDECGCQVDEANARIAELEACVMAAEGKSWKWADDFAKENMRAEKLTALLQDIFDSGDVFNAEMYARIDAALGTDG